MNLTDVWHFMKVFAWCMSFSIVINVKELLFRMREKKEWCIFEMDRTQNLKEGWFSVFNSNCQRLPKSAEMCVVFRFLKFISNNTQIFFVVTNENIHWHKIKANAFQLTFLCSFVSRLITLFVLWLVQFTLVTLCPNQFW